MLRNDNNNNSNNNKDNNNSNSNINNSNDNNNNNNNNNRIGENAERHLRAFPLYWKIRKQIKDDIMKEDYKIDELEEKIRNLMSVDNHYDKKISLIQQFIMKQNRNSSQKYINIPNLHIAKYESKRKSEANNISNGENIYNKYNSQEHNNKEIFQSDIKESIKISLKSFDDIIKTRLGLLINTFNKNLIRKRTIEEENNLKKNLWNKLEILNTSSNYSMYGLPGKTGCPKSMKNIYFYNDIDLYNIITSIKPKVVDELIIHPPLPEEYSSFWSSLPINIETPTIEEFRVKFKELNPNYVHLEVLKELNTEKTISTLNTRYELGNKIINSSSRLAARQYSKYGLPMFQRVKIYEIMLISEFTDNIETYTYQYCSSLKNDIIKYELLVDNVIQTDVKQIQNDDSYFIFEDILSKVMYYWARDRWLIPKIYQNNDVNDWDNTEGWFEPFIDNKRKIYPPNGIIPFWGISSYAIPFCYLYDNPDNVYMLFREFYSKYCSKLHTINNPKGLIYLCQVFEHTFKQLDSVLYFHIQYIIGKSPLEIVFPWIVYSFVGMLDIEQILLLWDRIIGFDSLELIPIAATCIFLYKKESLLQISNVNELKVRHRYFKIICYYYNIYINNILFYK
ncbi:hypothetical protein BCR36DRAFT_283197 [Piromyces finnis]|uniref:Rab-GAP TBC domain-containing protein n=1 Tax=Piromyces finnis TaxID=1754191 RepID=A0A1Y1VFQ3_9FUNG|nr:hypothetical protein BCR36DRAFT_283197 [Piromyces finnis]|eukprot:ORX54272.1 hypothetical protein BCR36DRAFT_283197 [Piromyces finnis]